MKRLLLLVALIATGCKGALDVVPLAPDPPKSNAPASIQLTAATRSDYQTTVVAMVYTADRRGVPNLPITFGTGAGAITSQQSTTDSSGRATAIVSTPMPTIVTAAASGISGAIEVAATVPTSIIGLPPVAPPDPGNAGLPAVVMNVASTGVTNVSMLFGVSAPGGQTWTWAFGDGTGAQTTAYTINHTYTAAGTYTATASSAGTRTGTATITVSDPPAPPAPPPAASTTLNATISCTPVAHGGPTPCNVSSLTYGSTTIPAGSITNVAWDWGDGATSNPAGAAATRTYVNAGTYTVVATVSAPTVDGPKTATATKSITVP